MAKRLLSGKRVLLTGASSGIGWHLAIKLAQSGSTVIATARRAERLEQLQLALGNQTKNFVAMPGDIADDCHRRNLITYARQQLGGLDLVINNAGVGAIGDFETATPERLRRIFEVDFFAVAELTRLALPLLHPGNQPAIVLIGSVLAHRAVARKSEYCAAKFALRGWAESLRLELRPRGIDVVMVSPSTTRSEFFDSLLDSESTGKNALFGAQSPESVALAVLQAICRGRRESILSWGGNALVWLNWLSPRLADYLLLRYAG